MRDNFYKYTDAETARAILENQTFRYSSPLTFNDPFDIQTDLTTDFDLALLPNQTAAVIDHFIRNDEPLPPGPDEGFKNGILIMRERSKKYGYDNSTVQQFTQILLEGLTDDITRCISEFNSIWQDAVRDSRVFCVTEEEDNLLMWAHYAKDHTGVVFQIATLPQLDTPLSAARKVLYRERPVKFYSMDEVIRWALFGDEPDHKRLQYSHHAFRKSTEWEYEKEWRVVDMCQYSRQSELFVDHRFSAEQLQKVIFGCRADEAIVRCLIELARKINPNVELLQAQKNVGEYSLDFKIL